MAERIARIEVAVEKLVEALDKGTKLEPWMFVRSEEYFDYDEPVILPCTIAPAAPAQFKEKPVKFLWLYADGAAIRVGLNRAVSSESFIIPNGALIWVRRKTNRVYGVAVAGAGNLHLWGFY